MALTEQSMQDLAVVVLVLQQLGLMPLGERIGARRCQVDTLLRRRLLLAAAFLALLGLWLLFFIIIIILEKKHRIVENLVTSR